jgi:hypothetical protein
MRRIIMSLYNTRVVPKILTSDDQLQSRRYAEPHSYP